MFHGAICLRGLARFFDRVFERIGLWPSSGVSFPTFSLSSHSLYALMGYLDEVFKHEKCSRRFVYRVGRREV